MCESVVGSIYINGDNTNKIFSPEEGEREREKEGGERGREKGGGRERGRGRERESKAELFSVLESFVRNNTLDIGKKWIAHI